ncbi:hypothetical protein WICMUC_005199 [Wickerhamomyces mucosus]|uniref:J domain-containing protein n=1 Tax=Wickerhamomyces mucosus TaxID=1378264 RepID=A0A9P8PAP7_9ASCO|nr:hypothetical protein WICMUC_005199 [Wickerhamomyces mucosus]
MSEYDKNDFYSILEILVDDHIRNVSSSLIKKSYRKLALQYHPDKGNIAGDIIFKRISNAYEILIDFSKKNDYDMWYLKYFKRGTVSEKILEKEKAKKLGIQHNEQNRINKEARQKEEEEKERIRKEKREEEQREHQRRRAREREKVRIAEEKRQQKLKEIAKREQEVLERRRQEERKKIEKRIFEEKAKESEAARLRKQMRKERIRIWKENQRLGKLGNPSSKESPHLKEGLNKESINSNQNEDIKTSNQQKSTPKQSSNPLSTEKPSPKANTSPTKGQTKTKYYKEEHLSKADLLKKIKDLEKASAEIHEQRESLETESESFRKQADGLKKSAEQALKRFMKQYEESLKRADKKLEKSLQLIDEADLRHADLLEKLDEYDELKEVYTAQYGEIPLDDEVDGNEENGDRYEIENSEGQDPLLNSPKQSFTTSPSPSFYGENNSPASNSKKFDEKTWSPFGFGSNFKGFDVPQADIPSSTRFSFTSKPPASAFNFSSAPNSSFQKFTEAEPKNKSTPIGSFSFNPKVESFQQSNVKFSESHATSNFGSSNAFNFKQSSSNGSRQTFSEFAEDHNISAEGSFESVGKNPEESFGTKTRTEGFSGTFFNQNDWSSSRGSASIDGINATTNRGINTEFSGSTGFAKFGSIPSAPAPASSPFSFSFGFSENAGRNSRARL